MNFRHCPAFLPKTACAFAVLACLSIASAHAGVANVSASFSNLTFEVIDLDPADGQAAQFQQVGNEQGLVYFFDADASSAEPRLTERFFSRNGFLPSSNTEIVGPLGRAGAMANGDMAAGVQIHLDYANQLLIDRDHVPVIGNPRYGALAGAWSPNIYSSTEPGFVLTPFSSVVIRARVAISSGLDLQGLQLNLLAPGETALLAYQASGSLGYTTAWGVNDGVGYDMDRSLVLDSSGVVSDEGGEYPAIGPDGYRDLELTITNPNESFLTGSLFLGTSAGASMMLSVPEPSTWATFALGLVGLAAASRRRAKA